MIKSEVIRTKRLLIEPFSKKHLTMRYVSWLNNPLVMRFSEQRHKIHTLDSCRQYLRSFKGTPHYFWAIVAQDKMIGHIGNINAYVDCIHRTADVGIIIGERSVWGQGYGLEAFKAVCSFLFKEKKMRKVTAGTLAVNSRMLRLMRKAGMVTDGRRIRHCLFEGEEVDVIHMAMFRESVKS